MMPMTSEILYAIKLRLNLSLPEDISFWAVCMIGFYGFLRKASMLPKCAKNHGTDCLLKGDAIINSLYLCTLKVRKTKTIQFGERILSIPYCANPGQPLCPVTALFQLFTISAKPDSSPLFSFRGAGNTWSCWTQDSFVTRLRKMLTAIGLDASAYSGHSFRRGGASLGFKLGLSISEIKKRGDWQSDAVESYIVLNEAQELAVAKKLVAGASAYLV